jgi:hypothetical protein
MLGRMSGAIPIVPDEPKMNRDSNGRFSPKPGRWRTFDNE